MTDPKRLLFGEGNPEEQNLLSAGAAEEPPPDGEKRLALALGLAAATARASNPATAESAKASSGALSKLLGAQLGFKAALVLGAGGALALALEILLARGPVRFDTRTPSAPPAHAPSASSARSAERVQAAPRLPDEPRAANAEPRVTAAAAAAAPVTSIADEVVRLDVVRSALSLRDSRAALTELSAYELSYPRGTLAPEAARLRVEAFLLQGDTRRAQALARAFLRAYPQSPHAAALRKIAGRPGRAEPHE
jgi:hypothetical protein